MKVRVLICDDAEFMRNLLKDIFTHAGFEVVGEAINGDDVVDKYKILKPDVVTMDIVMPVKSGIDAVREITEYDPKAKIVMCSALGQEILVMDAIEAGAKDFIVKPFTSEQVIKTIKKVLESEV
ncbi:MAG: response regulator [Proteobacteria bacterium]|nr:response regulator [Pseudomonadota bacterium]